MTFVDSLKDKEAHKSFVNRLLSERLCESGNEYSTKLAGTASGFSMLLGSVTSILKQHLSSSEVSHVAETTITQNAINVTSVLAFGAGVAYLLIFSQFTNERNKANNALSK